jgi:DNA-binding NarL/FixJ family response regulator
MRKISVSIADDHKLLRETLSYSLTEKAEVQIIFCAANGQDLLNKLKVEQPEVLLLDLMMPHLNGLDCLSIINKEYPGVRVLMLSSLMDEASVMNCLEHDINGFLTKDIELTEIIRAIELASVNEVYVSNLISNASLKLYIKRFKKKMPLQLPVFSRDELEMLNLLKQEKTTEEIAEAQDLSKRSIEIKRDKMKKKANVKTIGGLLIYALKRGLID